MGDFFFLNDSDDQEDREQHATHAAALTKQLIEGRGPQKKVNRTKQVTDFKVRALDFLSIYVKEKSYQRDSTTQIKLIRGL